MTSAPVSADGGAPVEPVPPPGLARLLLRRPRARHVVTRNVLVYRRIWLPVFAGFLEPVFYLFAIGVGLGQLVGEVGAAGGEAVGFASFVAPGLLAASAMNGAIYESTNMFFKLRYDKVYEAMLATPMGTRDIAVGELLFSQLRGLAYATGFLVVMAVLGLVHSPWALLALPAAMLIGFAFAGIGMAAATFMRSYLDFDYVDLVVLPLFLLSTTFFPLDVFPAAVRPIVLLSPLYHGVELLRSLTLGTVHPWLLAHAAVLVALSVLGMRLAGGRLERMLRS
jgi:lipooligosaccharide transport system permease protein